MARPLEWVVVSLNEPFPALAVYIVPNLAAQSQTILLYILWSP